MKSKLGIEKQEKVVRELYEDGYIVHRYEAAFWKEAAAKRMEQPRELEHIVWFCMEILKNEFTGVTDSKGKIFSQAFGEACRCYPKIHRLWYQEMIEIWVLKKSGGISYKERKNLDVFFYGILEGNMPPMYQSKDFIAFVADECGYENVSYYLEIYEKLFKEKVILNLRRQKDRELCGKIFHFLGENNLEKRNKRNHRMIESIAKVIWPGKCDMDLLMLSAKSLEDCDDILLLEKVRACGLINEKEIDVYLKELIYNFDLMVPFFIKIKYG